MRRTVRVLLVGLAAGLLAACVLAAPAAATTTYQLAGIETAATDTTGTFQGALTSQLGTWQATIDHGTLVKTPGGMTPITGGTVTIKPFLRPSVTGTGLSGTLRASAPVGGFFCTQQFTVSGGEVTFGTSTGAFGGTLTHYGIMSGGVCNAYFATIAGSVTMP
jgi:hypothetical protein